MKGGAKRRGVPVKTLKKLLKKAGLKTSGKKAGLKTSGKKAALTRRAKKARLMKGGQDSELVPGADKKAEVIGDAVEAADKADMGGRKRRKSRGFKLF